MAEADVHWLAPCITCHAWNKDRTLVALCPNNNEIHIYEYKDNKFTKRFDLKEHDQVVTAVDWAPESNRLVSCSQDRNAYVWNLDESGAWKPTLVILRINRAATHVKWSPQENKFAVASGTKSVSVCYFEEENNWWVSKIIKHHMSTVLCVDWHPNNLLLATGSSDGHCRVFWTAIKGPDKKRPAVFGQEKAPSYGAVLADHEAGGWVHSVSFSPSGSQLAFVSHDSTVGVWELDPAVEVNPNAIHKVILPSLPHKQVIFLNDTSLVAAGWDCNPTLFVKGGKGWVQGKAIDDPAFREKKAEKKASAFEKFESKTSRGEDARGETTLPTFHQNAITYLCVFSRTETDISEFTTTGSDGRLVFWRSKTLEQAFSALAV